MIDKRSIFIKNLQVLYKVNLGKTNEVHGAFLQSLLDTISLVKGDLDQAKLEMCLKTATGEWLDSWGDYFNIPREQGEEDKIYSQRIIDETIEPKVTVTALKKAVVRWLKRKYQKDYTQDDIVVFEPWSKLIKLSQRGTLDSDYKMPSEDYWTFGIVDISIPDSSLLTYELIQFLNTIKAAGVQIVWSIRPIWDVIIAHWMEDFILTSITSTHQIFTKPFYRSIQTILDKSFPGDDDADYRSVMDNPEYPMSGKQIIWWDGMGTGFELKKTSCPLRLYQNSAITTLEDFDTLIGKEGVTIGDALGYEQQELKSLHETNEGELTRTLWHVEVLQFPEILPGKANVYSVFVNNAGSHRNSVTRELLKKWGYSGLDYEDYSTYSIGNFVYPDWNNSYFDWISLEHLSLLIGKDVENISPKNLEENRVSILHFLIQEEGRKDNFALPVLHNSIKEQSDFGGLKS